MVRQIPDFQSMKESAASMFHTIQRALHIRCRASHRASICVEAVEKDSEPQKESTRKENREAYRVILHHDQTLAVPWTLEETEFRLIGTAGTGSKETPMLAKTSVGPVKKAHFHSTAQSRTADHSLATAATASLSEIQDLCEGIGRLRSQRCGMCMGVLSSAQHQHGLYRPQELLLDSPSLSIHTLSELIKHQAQGVTITNADARQLAVALATGMLRLHDTPWLMRSWTGSDISLLIRDAKVLATHPFISQDLHAQTSQSAADLPQTTSRIIRSPMLFSLGILLIEICMEKPIDELRHADEVNADRTLSDYLTTKRLVDSEEISNRFGQRWSDVVRRCIHCDLNQAKSSLEDADFRCAVYHEIYAKLEEERRHFFGLESCD